MDRDSFEAIVAEALDTLPNEFARHMTNVEVQVEVAPKPRCSGARLA